MTNMYDRWCNASISEDGKKMLWRIEEIDGGRDEVIKELAIILRSHYASDDEVATFMSELGHKLTAEIIRELYPATQTGESADLGEILAAEIISEWLDYSVPIKKLRDKDHREMAMRGEDIIGVAHDQHNRLKLLKGESKSAQVLGTKTVQDAREGLENHHGRPTPHSLIFIGRRLLMSNDANEQQLGREILTEATQRAVPKSRIAHLFFSLTGNSAKKMLDDDFESADPTRTQHITHLKIPDHADFVKAVFDEAQDANS